MSSPLKQRLARVEERIAGAAVRAGRSRGEILLVGVTKVFPASAIREAYEAGLRDFGENYVQEFCAKRPALEDLQDARFHLIGHLQSNKAKLAARLFHSVQTVDSAKLAHRLSDEGRSLEVMIEVKLSGEEAKSGVDPADLPGLVDTVRALPNLRLTGLMTMPPWADDPEQSRPYFAKLRQLAGQFDLPHLSMGMSDDFEVAVEEGATHIRVGTAIFGPRRRP